LQSLVLFGWFCTNHGLDLRGFAHKPM
jgi:hypothetical protein